MRSPLEPDTQYVVSIADQPALGAVQPTINDVTDDALDSDAVYNPVALASQVTVTTGTWGTNSSDAADFGFVEQFNIGDRYV